MDGKWKYLLVMKGVMQCFGEREVDNAVFRI